mmetsp:Transcript_2412/g.8882  ORF Transcript_2412/g.8882 Transcript_2412/m.8882 type:complete len:103 (-) Transcript_2412:733-1041(-)
MTRDESLCRARSTSTGVARRHLECNVVRDGVLCNTAQFRTRRDGGGAPVLDHVRHFTQCAAMANVSPCGALGHNVITGGCLHIATSVARTARAHYRVTAHHY